MSGSASIVRVDAVRDVITLKLKQDEAGQLGKICRRMAEAGVNIDTLYSDHSNQLILVVDEFDLGVKVARAWMGERPEDHSAGQVHTQFATS